MITRCVLWICSIAMGTTFECWIVCKVVWKTLSYGGFIEWEVGWKVVYEARLATSKASRLGKLVGRCVAPVNLRIAQSSFSLMVVNEVLTRCGVRAENVTSARNWQTFSTRDIAIAGCCPKSSGFCGLHLANCVCWNVCLVLAIVIRDYTIWALLLQEEDLIL